MLSNFYIIRISGAILCFISMSIFGKKTQTYLTVKDLLMITFYSAFPYLNYGLFLGLVVLYIIETFDFSLLFGKINAFLNKRVI